MTVITIDEKLINEVIAAVTMTMPKKQSLKYYAITCINRKKQLYLSAFVSWMNTLMMILLYCLSVTRIRVGILNCDLSHRYLCNF